MPKPAKSNGQSDRSSDARQPAGMTRVWDPFVRLFHWSLVTSFIVAWFTARILENPHQWAGYTAAALISVRIIWGFFGTRHARFSAFVRSPGAVFGYLADMARGREARYIGHNPAGGAMIVVLLISMSATALTGWMMTTDTYFGVDWVENLHSFFAHGMVVLVVLHVCGVIVASLRHRENLVKAMITGLKRREQH